MPFKDIIVEREDIMWVKGYNYADDRRKEKARIAAKKEKPKSIGTLKVKGKILPVHWYPNTGNVRTSSGKIGKGQTIQAAKNAAMQYAKKT